MEMEMEMWRWRERVVPFLFLHARLSPRSKQGEAGATFQISRTVESLHHHPQLALPALLLALPCLAGWAGLRALYSECREGRAISAFSRVLASEGAPGRTRAGDKELDSLPLSTLRCLAAWLGIA
ncbi:hypothetical protein M758_2G240300 [Ceratodon purpureus]|nr:hypothetical protein M758_2G240300 [Ceratodon purpureus]